MKRDNNGLSRTFVKDPDPVEMPTSRRTYVFVVVAVLILAVIFCVAVWGVEKMNENSKQMVEQKVGMVEDPNSKNEVQVNDDGMNLVYFSIKVKSREKTYIDELMQAFTEWKKNMPDGRIVSMTFVAPQMNFSAREVGLLVYYE